jgi:hypothetical protein
MATNLSPLATGEGSLRPALRVTGQRQIPSLPPLRNPITLPTMYDALVCA